MTEKIKSALKELLLAVLTAVVTFVTTLLCVSCGTTRAIVTNHADSTSTEIRITTNNPTSVSVPASATINPR